MYKFSESKDDSFSDGRRGFLKGVALLGGTFVFGFSVPLTSSLSASASISELNAWVLIHPDERVVIRFSRVEMGQGTLTGLAQLIAEELDCAWKNVSFELVNPSDNLSRKGVWKDQSTGGSYGVRGSQDYVRRGGATARAALISAAARQWDVLPETCMTSDGVVTHPETKRSLSYGQLVTLVKVSDTPESVELKDPSHWRIAGRALGRIDTFDKLDGSLKYGTDVSFSDMLIALPKSCPVHGGSLLDFDASVAEKMPGVTSVILVDDATIAVVADSFWRAKKAIDTVKINWDFGSNQAVNSEQIHQELKRGLSRNTRYQGQSFGDVNTVLAKSSRIFQADYSYPYQNHAQMEPLCATVKWTAERCDVWAPTQVPEAALTAAAEAAGLNKKQCEIHTMRIGGSFGRRLATDYISMATLIAKQFPDTPVKMMWTREEDMLQGRFHPVTMGRLRAALNENGEIDALHIRISGPSIFAFDNPDKVEKNGDPFVYQGLEKGGDMGLGYTFSKLLVDHAIYNPHIRPGYWRGVNLNQNTLYLESFIDELAFEMKQDPLAFRRNLMAHHPKHLAVLEAAAEKIGWNKPPADGRYRGLAQVKGFGSYVAAAAEVSVAKGRVKIHKIVAATDPGHVVNPQQVESQVAGSFVYGLSPLLYSECTVQKGSIAQTNFDSYRVMRLEDMPNVEVIVMPSGGFWGGVGEPTIAVAAPAVLNAIFAATGKRIRSIPLTKHDLS